MGKQRGPWLWAAPSSLRGPQVRESAWGRAGKFLEEFVRCTCKKNKGEWWGGGRGEEGAHSGEYQNGCKRDMLWQLKKKKTKNKQINKKQRIQSRCPLSHLHKNLRRATGTSSYPSSPGFPAASSGGCRNVPWPTANHQLPSSNSKPPAPHLPSTAALCRGFAQPSRSADPCLSLRAAWLARFQNLLQPPGSNPHVPSVGAIASHLGRTAPSVGQEGQGRV